MKKILTVEDDRQIQELFNIHLSDLGHRIEVAFDGREGLDKALSNEYDLIILDIMMPHMDGMEVCRRIRAEGIQTPILMLTSKAEEIDKVIGLELGADDYMTKPFEPRELIARVRVQLRTKSTPLQVDNKSISLKGIDFNFEKREVHYGGKVIELTKMEYELLKLLLVSPGKAFSREEILNKVWGYENYPTTRTVDTHVLQLRQKFWDEMIETIRGVGYRFNE